MKWFLLLALVVSLQGYAQTTTGILENQKDAWGISYTYIGEIKNGRPHGMGVAKYASGNNAIRYVGHFVDGQFSGRGTMLFKNGAFQTGMWSNGKMNGKGSFVNSKGVFYVGEMKDGLKHGKGTLVWKDNSMVKGNFVNDKMEGRCVYIWKEGKNISEIQYANDVRNGTGYQYESASKKLYEGEWKDDEWVRATAANFASFLNKGDFVSEITDNHILMGSTTSDGILTDTSFYYDLKKKKRYFGHYERGFLRNGIMYGDSSRFIGQFDQNGATGYCYELKLDQYYSEGNFVNDLLDGEIVDISLTNLSVYYGGAKQGYFTGKAYFFASDNSIYCGDVVRGKFTGEGWMLDSKGRCVKGIWENGVTTKVISITNREGKTVAAKPASFSDALNFVSSDFEDFFYLVRGKNVMIETDYAGAMDVDVYSSMISFPGSVGEDQLALNFYDNNFYVSKFIETKDFNKAKAKYNEIAKLVQQTTIKNDVIRNGVKLTGTVTAPNAASTTVSRFDFPSDIDNIYQHFHVWVELSKNEEGSYEVIMKAGEWGAPVE